MAPRLLLQCVGQTGWRTASAKTCGSGAQPPTNSSLSPFPGTIAVLTGRPTVDLIAFTSDRLLPDEKPSEGKDRKDKEETPGRIWIVSADGGEARPLYRTKDDVHSFAWAPDSAIYLAIQEPLSKDQTDAKERDWKDVTRYRISDRGDVLLRIPVPPLPTSAAQPNRHATARPRLTSRHLPEGATVIARSPLAIDLIKVHRHSGTIAFVTGPISHRLERPEDTEIYSVAAERRSRHAVDPQRRPRKQPALVTRWPAALLHRAGRRGLGRRPVSRCAGAHLFDLRTRRNAPSGSAPTSTATGRTTPSSPMARLLATGRRAPAHRSIASRASTQKSSPVSPEPMAALDAAAQGDALLLTHSAIREPVEVYIASSPAHLDQAKPLTHLQRALSRLRAIRMAALHMEGCDGTTVEGVLIYPPGKRDAKHLPMLTLIHGGPADADGDRFGADWYDWATLAAAQGWLVFRPNYRGSTGYGDTFMQQITPHLVSVPGKDILAGVDALVDDGTADPSHLAIGGYSYGGYMTNWLITQTTRFKRRRHRRRCGGTRRQLGQR